MDAEFESFLTQEKQAELQRQKEVEERTIQQEETVMQLMTDFQFEYDEARKKLEENNWNYPVLKNNLNASRRNEQIKIMTVMQNCPSLLDEKEIRLRLIASNWDERAVVDEFKRGVQAA